MKHEITPEVMNQYEAAVQQEDLKPGTVEKYMADLRKLKEYLAGEELTQDKLDGYPRWLLEERNYKKRSVNAIVVSTRRFCQTMGWAGLEISGYTLDHKERKSPDRYISRPVYQRLVTTAMYLEHYQMAMLIQTLCHMDIRYSELPALTVEKVQEGYTEVSRRQKLIVIDMPDYLSESLLLYAEEQDITEGLIFRTATGRLPDRSYIWRGIKSLCEQAGLDAGQVNMQKLKMAPVPDYYPFYPMMEKVAVIS